MNRITYFPPETQRQYALNRARVANKPYAHYFDGDLWIHDEAMEAIRAPIDAALALAPTATDINRLLDPGYLPVETGYCELPDGSAYVASRVPFPGCTGDMLAWWFWWHAVEAERYTLWYPHNHVSATPLDRSVLERPGLSHVQRYVGTTHRVDEFIGPTRMQITIRFVEPSELGLAEERFAAAGIVGHACARVTLLPAGLEAVTMVHLARQTSDGFELRSHYWLGHDVRLRGLSVDRMGAALGIKRRMGGARMAYEQLLHDQIEFTHLSTFLAPIYAEFGPAGQ
ncbi:MAG: hypothetical protein QM778_12235 [Myxococcales bacterium]